MNLQPILQKAILQSLSQTDAREAALALMTGDVPPAQAGGLLSVLRVRGENGSEILGFARALREHAVPFPIPFDGLIDTCGTGGDGLSTFNVSTLAAIVAAGAGARVAKHGNRAVSSRCGSADLLEALGVRVDVPPEVAARCIDETGFGFLFAPHYHKTLRHLAPIRRELGFRSIFNLVGPLANPACVRQQVLGVSSPAYLRPVAEALHALGAVRAFVVHGEDGSDELSLVGSTSVIEVRPDGLHEHTFHPRDAGLSPCQPEDLVGGDAATNASIATAILDGVLGPAFDFVVLNAAVALVAAGLANSLRDGAEMAHDAVLSFKARGVLDGLKRISQEAA